MEPSAGVPGPTGNQHFQTPLNSPLSEAEKLLVPPQHHRVVNKSAVYPPPSGFLGEFGAEPQLPGGAPGMDAGEGACPGTAHELRTVAQAVLAISRIVVRVLRDHPILLLLPTSQQTPNPPLPHKGLTREIWDGQEHSQPSQPSLKAFKCEQGCNFQSWSREIFL